MKSAYHDAIPFYYVLLEGYKKLGLSEDEAMVVLMIDHLISQGNLFVSNDLLSLKMGYSPTELDGILNSLLKKGFLSYPSKSGKTVASIDQLKDAAYALFAKNAESQRAALQSADRVNVLTSLYSFFEEKLGRTLSPLERDSISDFLIRKYTEDDIKNALLDNLREGKKSIKAVERTLKARRKEADLLSEGASAVSDDWDEDIRATMEYAKTFWGK